MATFFTTMGQNSLTGPESEVPESAEILVRYQSDWAWDITFYLYTLHIQFVDAHSMMTLATGTSTHSSFSRKSKSRMAEEVLSNIFEGKVIDVDSSLIKSVAATDIRIVPENQIGAALPIDVEVIAHGTQAVSDEAFAEALESSIHDYGLFRSISNAGDYRLVVALHSIEHDETRVYVLGFVVHHNIFATTSWALTDTATGEILYNSEIVTSCPEDELRSMDTIKTMTACAMRANIARGIEELSAIELD